MRIAIPVLDGAINEHYGHTEYFMIYECDNNTIIKEELLKTNGRGHVYMAKLLNENNVNSVIAFGMGLPAKEELTKVGIKFYPGVGGNPKARAQELLDNTLVYDINATCSDHKEKATLNRKIVK